MTVFLRRAQDRILAPVLFLGFCILAYGVQIPWLGFYLDDWIILNAYNLGGVQRVFEYAFYGNRPLVVWAWWIGFKLFGSLPAGWQLWALLWRWLTVVILWLGWRELWPKAIRQVTLAAVLFAIYPLFRQQASALTYSFHWICFFLYGLSIYLMILAVRRPARFSLYMAGSLLVGGLQLFSQEFFVGIELLRPLILWLAMRATVPGWKERLRRVLLTWAPYVVILIGYLVWRMALMPTAGSDRNAPDVLYGLFSTPLSALSNLATMLMQDVVETLLGVWYKSYQPDLITLKPISNVLAWGIAAAAFLLALAFFFLTNREPAKSYPEESEPWYKTAIPFGLLAMLLGFAPGWSIGRHIYDLTGIYNDRFGLAATFGAAIVVVALLELLLKKTSYQVVLVCLLIGLGTGQNARFVNQYRQSWEKQSKLYWQLKWRAPSLKQPTAVIGDGALISYMGSWATISALVQMYEPTKNTHFVDYWYVSAQDQNPDIFNSKSKMLVDQQNFMRYRAPAQSSLVISFEPEQQQCLWVLTNQDQKNRYVTDALKEVLAASDVGRILQQPDQPLRQDIFGPELAHDWCYYFEKGDLARQYQEWKSVVSLWNQAAQAGKHPRVGVEYAPFIEGFAHTGDWQTAIDLTRKAYFPKYEVREYLCQTWKQIAVSTNDTAEKQRVISEVIDNFECQDEFRP